MPILFTPGNSFRGLLHGVGSDLQDAGTTTMRQVERCKGARYLHAPNPEDLLDQDMHSIYKLFVAACAGLQDLGTSSYHEFVLWSQDTFPRFVNDAVFLSAGVAAAVSGVYGLNATCRLGVEQVRKRRFVSETTKFAQLKKKYYAPSGKGESGESQKRGLEPRSKEGFV